MQVSDGIAAAVVLRFQIAVQAVDNAPVVAAIVDQTATEGAAFDFDLSTFVTDADTPAGGITYSVIDGLPPGVTLASNGRLSGTPDARRERRSDTPCASTSRMRRAECRAPCEWWSSRPAASISR